MCILLKNFPSSEGSHFCFGLYLLSQVCHTIIFWKLFLFWSSDEGKPVFNGLVS
jgi:hypothetical protein